MAAEPATLSWWDETPRMDLEALMDELDPGWSSWDAAGELTPRR